jgi:hypothetical protein
MWIAEAKYNWECCGFSPKQGHEPKGRLHTYKLTYYMYEIAEKNSTTNKVQSINTDIYSIF